MLAAMMVPASRRLSTMSAFAGLTVVLAGSNALIAELGPKAQRWALVASLSLLAGALALLSRMILRL
jgi:hypothetical protein